MHASHTPRTRYMMAVLGLIVWTTLVLGLYYWVHKPINPPLARAAGGALLDIVVALVLILVSAGIGIRAFQWIDISGWSTPERIAAPVVVGLGMVSLLVMVVGALTLTRTSMISVLFVLFALTFRDIGRWGTDLVGWLRTGLPPKGFERFVALVTVIMLGMALIIATLPPTKFDVLTYHLAGPEQYVTRGRFYAVPHNHFLGFPQGMETLYAAQLAITGQLTGGGVLHWFVGVLTLMMAGGFAARKSNALAGWVTVGALLTALSVWMEMTFAYTDLLPMALTGVGLAVVDRWAAYLATGRELGPWRFVLLLGLLAGLGMGTKYSVLWMVIAFGVLVLWFTRRYGWRRMVLCGVMYGTAAGLVVLPWLIRNAIWYDNPLYPFVFESAEMDAIRQDWYRQPESGLIYGANAWQIPVLPLMATFIGLEGAGIFGATIGPMFLVLVPAILLVWSQLTDRERQTARHAAIIGGIVFAAWLLSSTFGSYISLQSRLVFYMFVPLAILAGFSLSGLRRLPKKPLDVGFVVQAMVVFTLLLTVIDGGRFMLRSGVETYYSGEDDYRDEFLREELGWHFETMQHISTTLPQDSRVRFLWEPRYLYCDQERITCRTDSLMDAWYYARRTLGDPAEIAAQWRAEGADYLLVYELGRRIESGEEGENHDGNALYHDADWPAWATFVESNLTEEWRGEEPDGDVVYILYRWND